MYKKEIFRNLDKKYNSHLYSGLLGVLMNYCHKKLENFKKKLLNNPFCYKTNNKKLNILLAQSKYWCPSYLDGDAIVDL